MTTFPIQLRVAGRRVVVVGAGSVGRRRAASLLESGARLRWVAPDVPTSSDGQWEAVAAPFEEAHLDDVDFVLACATREVNHRVIEASHRRSLLAGDATGSEGSDFEVPACLRQGPLLLTLSTSPSAPAATARLRRALLDLVPSYWSTFVSVLQEVRGARPAGADRRALLQRLANGPILDILATHGEPAARAYLASVLSEDVTTAEPPL